MMRKSFWIVLAAVVALVGVSAALGQQVTQPQVDAFLERMYGFDPEVKWKVVAIRPAADANFTEVVYYLGAEPAATHLFVPKEGKFAIAGKMVPFGADPFADARDKLAKSTTGISRGSKDAKLTLVVFSDLECPHCKRGEPIAEKLQEDMPGSLLVFQQFPLEQIHPWSLMAAKYSDCAGLLAPEKAFAFNDAIFAQQEQITEQNAAEKLNAIVTAQGLDAAKVGACVQTPETAQRVEQSIDLGKSVGVTGTPTLFINGRKVDGIADVPYEQLKALAEFEAKQAR